MRVLGLAVITLCAVGVHGAPLPDSPMPHAVITPVKQERFWTRPVRIEAGAMVGLAAFDMGQTCHNLANGGMERMLPTERCPVAIALTGAFDLAAVGGAWLLHRTHHDKLALVPMAFMSEQSARAIVYSRQHHAW